jgi:site-specific recombinase XerD
MASLPVPRAGAGLQDGERLTAANALHDALASARDYALADKADATRHAYRSDYQDFASWAASVDRCPCPAEASTVAGYLAVLAERRLKASTIRRRLAAIRHAHRLKGVEPPTSHPSVQAVHQGIRRRLGARVNQKSPATAKAIAAMVRRAPVDTLAGLRDRALLLVGFSAALRRSELVALDVEDIETAAEGVIVTIKRSKVDQEGRGTTVAVPNGRKLMPVAALRDYVSAANLSSGPLFRRIGRGDRVTGDRLTPQSVALIVKKYAKLARLDPDSMSGHSLRSGLVTEALSHGADVFAVADQGRWRKLETVREYDRRARAFKDNVGRSFL